MVKQYNTSANFTNLENTEFDGGLKSTDTANRVYLLEEASGIVMNDIGTDGVDGVRDADLTQVAGKFAGRFATKGDGTNYNEIPWSSNFRNEFTWDFWIKPTATDLSGFHGIMGGWNNTPINEQHLTFTINSAKLTVYYGSGGLGFKNVSYTTNLVADTWYHVRFSYGAANGGVLSTDGVERDSDLYVGDLYDFNKPYHVFADNGDGTSLNFNGALADLRFYNSALSGTYSVPTEYYNPSGTSLIHDSGVLYSDSGSGFGFDNSTALETASDLTVEYQYADYASPQAWSTASDVNDNAIWNGSWLTLAQLLALDDPESRVYRYLKTRITGTGSLTEFSIDLYALDLTPPSDVSATANSALSGAGTTFDLVTTFTGGNDIGGSGYAGANLEIEEGGVSYFQQSDGSFLADETFANLLLKGEADSREIIYALGRDTVPTRFRINSYDNAENYNRGEWVVPFIKDLDNIISTAGGNYNVSNLISENVKLGIEFGIDDEGSFDPIDFDNIISTAGGNYNVDKLIPYNVVSEINFGLDQTGTRLALNGANLNSEYSLSITFTGKFTENSAQFYLKADNDFVSAVVFIENGDGDRRTMEIESPGSFIISNMANDTYKIFAITYNSSGEIKASMPLNYTHHCNTFLGEYLSGLMTFSDGTEMLTGGGEQMVLSSAERERDPSFKVLWHTDRKTDWQEGLYSVESTRERIVTNNTAHWLQFKIKSNGASDRVVINSLDMEMRIKGRSAEASG